MVEGDPPTKNTQDCDVKDDRVLNGCGSKDLELANLTTLDDRNRIPADVEKGCGACEFEADFEGAINAAGYGKLS